jgi:deoxyadenosine/deoxycytidine kinase
MAFSKRSRNSPVRISIEGNIATGKSTFIKILEDASGAEDWEITPEPVSQWTQIDGEKKKSGKESLLKLFYAEPHRYAYTMESFTFMTRVNVEKQRSKKVSTVTATINERSVYSSKYIFARNCYETGLMTETEWAIYQEWSSYLLNSLGELQLDGLIYLRADPKVCSGRMSKRGRPEEQGVTLEYLNQLHEKHEAWLHRREFSNENIMADIPILEIDCNMEFHDDEQIKSNMLQQVRVFVKQLQSAKRTEIERQIGLHDDSGVDSVSRSTSPSTSDTASPVPFADITTAEKNSKDSSKRAAFSSEKATAIM